MNKNTINYIECEQNIKAVPLAFNTTKKTCLVCVLLLKYVIVFSLQLRAPFLLLLLCSIKLPGSTVTRGTKPNSCYLCVVYNFGTRQKQFVVKKNTLGLPSGQEFLSCCNMSDSAPISQFGLMGEKQTARNNTSLLRLQARVRLFCLNMNKMSLAVRHLTAKQSDGCYKRITVLSQKKYVEGKKIFVFHGPCQSQNSKFSCLER